MVSYEFVGTTKSLYIYVDVYPLPNVEEMFAVMSGGANFTKLDLTNAYQQMELDEKSRDLVTINTHQGLYQYIRLPFGIFSAPAVFQRTMDTILQGLDKVVCYIDDILLIGVDDDDHLRTLEVVLHRLQQHGITVKKEKCTFMSKSVEFLGYNIDVQGLHTTPDKLNAILKAPYPINVWQLRSFVGLLNYYNRFIPNLASILHPLHNLLKHHGKWKWTTSCSNAVDEARRRLVLSDLLVHFDPQLPLKLDTDASAYGLGAVISHTCKDGKERPIAFASRTLSKSEVNYAQLEKEALAIIFGVKKFHKYLYGKHFVLNTDHKPLTTILSPCSAVPTLAAARLQCWALLLSAYSYSIGYRSTDQHGNADSLSRLPLPDSNWRKLDTDSMFNIVHMSSLPLTHKQLKSATLTDQILSKVRGFMQSGWLHTVQQELAPFWRRRNELSVEVGCVLLGQRVVIPQKLRQRVLEELHIGHSGICRMKALARSYLWWPSLDFDIEQMAKSCHLCLEVKSTMSSPTSTPGYGHTNLGPVFISILQAHYMEGCILLQLMLVLNGQKSGRCHLQLLTRQFEF